MRIEIPQEGASPQGAIDATVEKLLIQALAERPAEKLFPKEWIVGSGRAPITRPLNLSRWAQVENAGIAYLKNLKHSAELPAAYTIHPGGLIEISLPAGESPTVRHGAASRDIEIRKLQEKVRFLETQLKSEAPYLQLYRLGAGFVLMSVVSIAVWLLTGIGIPFHPLFAAIVTPAAAGVIVMAFLVRRSMK